ELFKGCEKRIIVTTFASNVQRIQQIINVAAKYKRKVAVTGRSMENMIRVAMELGYMDIPEGVLMDLTQIKGQPKSHTVIISTGSQGESMSALYRMAFSEHKQINIDAGDRVIISASAIPGNETTISRVIDELFHKGAEVIYDRRSDLHVSGHASQEEQKMVLALTKPRFFIPVHGEYRMLCKHADIAHMMGVDANHTVVAENGSVIELSRKTVKMADSVPAGRVFVDGSGVGDVGSVVLRDRKHLAEDGMIVVTIALSSHDGELLGGPDILTRGFIYERDSEGLIDEMKRVVHESLASCRRQRITDQNGIKNKIRTNLTGYLYKATKRSPMILPMITTI
ncbi:MAG TPA: ribonuclease J, partial [Candidatus Scatomorpha stercoravium]|nr:ribonuclease J [Candidatus Scatomorpha stercoravium]